MVVYRHQASGYGIYLVRVKDETRLTYDQDAKFVKLLDLLDTHKEEMSTEVTELKQTTTKDVNDITE